MAVNILEGGSGTTIIVQQRSDKSAQRNILSEQGEYDIIVPRFIYSKLGNLTNHKNINVEDMSKENNEYQFFMMELERFFESGMDIDNVAAIDEYLSSLGVSIDYPFGDDTYAVDSWIETIEQNESRNVISKTLDSDEEETNVVTIIQGTIYNVLHRT